MCWTDLAERILDEDLFIPLLIAGGIVLCSLFKTVGSTIRATARERTRRDIAAYIAEGSLTPDQGERLMRAGQNKTEA